MFKKSAIQGRRVGDFIRRHETTVSAFYASNVEVYLRRAQMPAFCANLASLPHTWDSSFIENKGMRRFESKLKACAPLLQVERHQ